ncbi:hypothetical protein [Rhabdochlamydiaceae symbiont of Dictyostelium giganteum]|uniref:hypothetical protein n=1 Tax=Rhabdochlamydiaceae symbiont of Dictyostelium giganteum TaxID=3342349 RepID=UPI00384C7DB5
MQSLGVIQDNGIFRWAHLSSLNAHVDIKILREEESPPLDLLLHPDITVVTPLSASLVLRKELTFPQTSRSLVSQGIDFQLGMTLPFPLKECQLFSEYTPQDHKMKTTSWIAHQKDIKTHLEAYQAMQIDPDQISLEPLAIARWAKWVLPHLKKCAIIMPPLGVVIDEGRVICSVHVEDSQRLSKFIEQKYPLFPVIDESYCPSLENLQFSFQTLFKYAVAIGSALEPFEHSQCQFRLTPSLKKHKKEARIFKRCLLGGASLFLGLCLLSLTLLSLKKMEINKALTSFPHLQSSPYEKAVSSLQHQVIQEKKKQQHSSHFPSPLTLLSLFSSLPSNISIERFTYKMGEPLKKNLPLPCYVTLEFHAKTDQQADQFTQQIKHIPDLVEPNYELKWTSSSNSYTLSFPLQKESPIR